MGKRHSRQSSHHTKHRKYSTRDFKEAEYMGIDWGEHDVGIALADKEMQMAFAHTTLENSQKTVEKIGALIRDKGVKTVVIGIPSPINREEVRYEAERLGELLEHNYGVVVYYQNEMFSTKVAERQLIEKGVRGIERFDDQEAARVILQDWLDRETLVSNR